MIFKKKHFLLELTDHELRLVRVNRLSHSCHVEAITRESPSDPGGIRRALDVLGAGKSASSNEGRLAVFLRSSYFLLSSLDSSQLSKKAHELLEYPRSALGLDSSQYTTQLINPTEGSSYIENGKQREWLFAGAKSSAFSDVLGRAETAGLHGMSIEMAPISTLGMLMDIMRFQQTSGALLLLFMGVDASQVFVLTQERLVSTRSLPIGFKSLVASVEQSLGIDNEKEAKDLLISGKASIEEHKSVIAEGIQRELESFAGFYELQMSQAISQLCIIPIHHTLEWLGESISKNMDCRLFNVDLVRWLEFKKASWKADLDLHSMGPSWLPVMSLIR